MLYTDKRIEKRHKKMNAGGIDKYFRIWQSFKQSMNSKIIKKLESFSKTILFFLLEY
jgi:hypothetical protein